MEDPPEYANRKGWADAYPIGALCLRWAIGVVNDEEAGAVAHTIADAVVRQSKYRTITIEDRCLWLGLCGRDTCEGGALFVEEEDGDEIETLPFVGTDGTEITLDDCEHRPEV